MTPEEIIEYFGIEKPDEIDLDAICFYFNAEVQRHPLSGCEGRIIGVNDKAIITVNSNSSQNRQRFSAAHELGHWMLDRGNVNHACTEATLYQQWKTTALDNIEMRANHFGAKLLMPEHMIKEEARGRKFRIKDVKKISEAFNVSITATAFRLLDLDLMTGMLIWSDGLKKTSFLMSRSYPRKAWPVDQIDKESSAYFIKDKNIGESYGGSVQADVWINRSDASYHQVYEDSIVVAPNKLLTLLSWESEKYLIRLLDK